MRVTFVGVGEAFDDSVPNTSLFLAGLTGGTRATVLLDCGFTAASAFFACPTLSEADREEGPDAVWLSHFHGDHFFGLPWLVARLHEAGRTRELPVFGGPDVAGRVWSVLDLAYPHLREKLGFAVRPVAVADGEAFSLAGLPARAAATEHGAPCLAVRLETEYGAFFYSGGGRCGPACRDLASGCALAVFEAYAMEAGTVGHGSVEEALNLAGEAWVEALALVHVRRSLRRERGEDLRRALAQAPLRAFLPEPGTVFEV
jgi:ribonuclease Z